MPIKLQKAIIEYMYVNRNYMNLLNNTKEEFREYIYDKNGNHLIGGETVYNFILDIEKLISTYCKIS